MVSHEAVKLVEGYIVRLNFGERRVAYHHELGVGIKNNIFGNQAVGILIEIFRLRIKNIFWRRQPTDSFVGELLTELEADIWLAGAGRVNDSGFACLLWKYNEVYTLIIF